MIRALAISTALAVTACASTPIAPESIVHSGLITKVHDASIIEGTNSITETVAFISTIETMDEEVHFEGKCAAAISDQPVTVKLMPARQTFRVRDGVHLPDTTLLDCKPAKFLKLWDVDTSDGLQFTGKIIKTISLTKVITSEPDPDTGYMTTEMKEQTGTLLQTDKGFIRFYGVCSDEFKNKPVTVIMNKVVTAHEHVYSLKECRYPNMTKDT